MKNKYLIILLLPLFVFSCSEGKLTDSAGSDVMAGVTELILNQKISGTISENGDVDIYRFKPGKTNSILRVRVTSNTLRPDVDLLVSVYRLNEEGEKRIVYADHAREDSLSPAEISMNIFVGNPDDLYIYVRDLKDDDSSANPYYISVDFETDSEGNDTFADAQELLVDDVDCKSGTIGYIGDVDLYWFNAEVNGVYDIQSMLTLFKGGSDIDLSVKVYSESGELVYTFAESQKSNNTLLQLTANKYYLLVEEFGKDDFDNSSPYGICVKSVEAGELLENDSANNAFTPVDISSITGSLEYLGDEDWYTFDVSESEISFTEVTFEGSGDAGFNYLIKLVDSDGRLLLSHSVKGNSVYRTRIKVNQGRMFLVITPKSNKILKESLPYSASVKVINAEIDATGESSGNSIDTAYGILSGEVVTGSISYRGDEDWYSIPVSTVAPQVMEIFFNAAPSSVEFDIKIIRDGVVKRIFNPRSTNEPTGLKTSLFIPAGDPAVDANYMIKIADYQDNDGDSAAYSLQVNLAPMPNSVARGAATYYREDEDLIDDSEKINLVYNALTQKEFHLNKQLFDPLNPPAGSEITTLEEIVGENTIELTKISFPWVGGFIDYQGDQDWFIIPNVPLNKADTVWYYDIKIEMQTDSPGSDVEYVWRYYPDRNKNRRVMLGYSASGDDGMLASAGDTTTQVEPLDITVPDLSRDADEKFWVGSRWLGDAYLSVSDFNYTSSETPDDDWGYDAEYYLKVTLTYHPGVAYPAS